MVKFFHKDIPFLVIISVHQSSSSPTIYKGGDSSLNIYGGCNTIGNVSFNLPSASAPDLGQGKPKT